MEQKNFHIYLTDQERTQVSYDVLEMSGSRAVWKDVLAVYAVKTNTDQDNPQEVATMDDSKKQILTDIFDYENKENTRIGACRSLCSRYACRMWKTRNRYSFNRWFYLYGKGNRFAERNL